MVRNALRLIHTASSLSNQIINLSFSHVIRGPVTRVDSDVAAYERTAFIVWVVGVHRGETLPAEVVAALVARHVVASAVLFNVETAFGTGLCAEFLDLLYALGFFKFGGFAAPSIGVPGAVAGQAELVVAVRAGDFLRAEL
jgi:hypothetical protein